MGYARIMMWCLILGICNDTEQKRKLVVAGTVNRTYITPLGEVLVCPYINISIGNIKEQSLKEILIDDFLLNILVSLALFA